MQFPNGSSDGYDSMPPPKAVKNASLQKLAPNSLSNRLKPPEKRSSEIAMVKAKPLESENSRPLKGRVSIVEKTIDALKTPFVALDRLSKKT